MKIASVLLLVLLTGCANVQPAINGFEAAALTTLRNAEDNNIRLWALNACATPFSALTRHPELVPTIKALCIPAGAASNPYDLLDSIQNGNSQ